jgi:hypothetical protein
MLRIQRRQSALSFDPHATPEIAVRRHPAHAAFAHLILAVLAMLALAGCATPQAPPPRPDPLLRDDLFGPSSAVVDAKEIFALSDAMKRYLRTDVLSRTKAHGIQGGLFEALYNRAQLKLDYDSSVTRTAAEAFDATACRSL